MRGGHYQTPGLYYAQDDPYSGGPGYPDMPLELLDASPGEQYPSEPGSGGYTGLDHGLGKHLSLDSYQHPGGFWAGPPGPSGPQELLEDQSYGRSRHNRSVSLSGDPTYGMYSTPERRLRPSYPGSGGFPSSDPRQLRYNAPYFNARQLTPQVRGPLSHFPRRHPPCRNETPPVAILFMHKFPACIL